MPNHVTADVVEVIEYEEDDFSSDDFGFVIGPDGDLKSLMIPEHLMDDPPEQVKIILALFGIDNIHELGNKTVH